MRHIVSIGIACAAALAPLGAQAEVGAPEARNPFHCSIALQVAHALARAAHGPEGPLTHEVHSRLVWQALAAARFPKTADADVQADALRTRFSENREEGLAMAEACMRRQDAHPGFQAARIEKQIREGINVEPANIRTVMVELIEAYRQPETSAAAGTQP
jgi:hypothetical protein